LTTTIVQNSVPLADMANALSAFTFFQTVGGALGVAVLGAVLNSKVATRSTEGYGVEDSTVYGLNFVFTAACVPAVLTFLGSLLIKDVVLFQNANKTQDATEVGAQVAQTVSGTDIVHGKGEANESQSQGVNSTTYTAVPVSDLTDDHTEVLHSGGSPIDAS